MESRQQSLPLAYEAIAVTASVDKSGYWSLRMKMRRQGQLWDEVRSEVYSYLDSDELIDAIDVVLCRNFGTGGDRHLLANGVTRGEYGDY